MVGIVKIKKFKDQIRSKDMTMKMMMKMMMMIFSMTLFFPKTFHRLSSFKVLFFKYLKHDI